MQRKRFLTLIAYQMLSIAGIASLSMAAGYADDGAGAFLPRLVVSSTVPANGDLNPYGVAFVPQGFPAGGSIAPGDVLRRRSRPQHQLRTSWCWLGPWKVAAASKSCRRHTAHRTCLCA